MARCPMNRLSYMKIIEFLFLDLHLGISLVSSNR